MRDDSFWSESFCSQTSHSTYAAIFGNVLCVTWFLHGWHVSFKRVTWCLHMSDDSFRSQTTHSTYAAILRHVILISRQHRRFPTHLFVYLLTYYIRTITTEYMCVTWLLHICDITSSYMWHDSFIYVTWRIPLCNTTGSYVWHDSSICVTWRIHMCYATHSHM